MSHEFDPGYDREPFKSLCENHPDENTYPQADFRVEWGPVFHRGRLDGSARILVIGQDPATHESIVHRSLVGEAGQRVQGFLGKLGFDRSYVYINVFLFSVYGQAGGERHKNKPGIIAYRHLWMDALLDGTQVAAVVALGGLADHAWKKWIQTDAGMRYHGAYAKVYHPTFPESSAAGGTGTRKSNTEVMLQNWNLALQQLHPLIQLPDTSRDLVLYGKAFVPGDLMDIPEFDVPAGVPAWMRGQKAWAVRTGVTPEKKRATITVTVPGQFMPVV